MQAELEKAKFLNEKFEAYQALMKNSNQQPTPGHYRTKSGSHIKIVSNGTSWTQQEVSDEEQQLPFGFVWVPYASIDQTRWPMTIQELYYNGAPTYQPVMPQQVGFSYLGDDVNQHGAIFSTYQLNKLTVVENGPNNVGYQAVSTTVLDLSREHIRVFENGVVEVVPPVPEAYRSLLHHHPLSQPQPALAQQIPQQAVAQPVVAGPSQIPAPSFVQEAEPQTWIDEDARTRSNTYETTLSGNTSFTNGEGHIPDASLLQNVDMNNLEGNDAKMEGMGQNGMGLGPAGVSDLDMDNLDLYNYDLTNISWNDDWDSL